MLIADASTLGWGVHLGSPQMQVLWSSEDLALYIIRELKAVRLASQIFLSQIRESSLLILTDNMAAMFYLGNQGRAPFSPLSRSNSTLGDLYCQLNISRSI